MWYGPQTRRVAPVETLMTSEAFELFRDAIAHRKQVICTYHGQVRHVCPHTLGYKNEHEYVLTFQFAGGSSTDLPPTGQWRCLEIYHVKDLTTRGGDWHTGPRHTRPQKCVDRIVAQVD